MRAEIIAIGDELTCGYRLDTNSKWISEQLTDTGVTVAFHTTVGDELADIVHALKTAAGRVEMIICTGGLGPTADDLTRQAVAAMADVALEFDSATLEHIRGIFEKHGRSMPEQNNLQAYFPKGSSIIANPEGTAPGFEFLFDGEEGRAARIWTLPGVPYEMQEMWSQTVARSIAEFAGIQSVICHHTLHCFGAGESRIESMLPDLISRERIPRVGITASKATISLRVTAEAASRQQCLEQMQPTLKTIRECLGDLVFGENGQQLQDVVVGLLCEMGLTLGIVDFGFGGAVGQLLGQADESRESITGCTQLSLDCAEQWLGQVRDESWLQEAARRIRIEFAADWGVAIGPIGDRQENGVAHFDIVIVNGETAERHSLNFGGHSKIRWDRSQKQVLNQIRLNLLASAHGSDVPQK